VSIPHLTSELPFVLEEELGYIRKTSVIKLANPPCNLTCLLKLNSRGLASLAKIILPGGKLAGVPPDQ